MYQVKRSWLSHVVHLREVHFSKQVSLEISIASSSSSVMLGVIDDRRRRGGLGRWSASSQQRTGVRKGLVGTLRNSRTEGMQVDTRRQGCTLLGLLSHLLGLAVSRRRRRRDVDPVFGGPHGHSAGNLGADSVAETAGLRALSSTSVASRNMAASSMGICIALSLLGLQFAISL